MLHDATVAAVAASVPTSTDALLAIAGLGPVKVARWGDQLLSVVAAAAEGA
ncbi:MAG: HRDC domain-containing protein [Acidimicrobiales bacterium]